MQHDRMEASRMESVAAASGLVPDLTVNEAEYRGLIYVVVC